MRQYNIDYWNDYKKPSKEVDVVAVPGDLVVEIGGILYLVQRTNDANNIVCFRIDNDGTTALASFRIFRKWLIANGIIYIRVEGNPHRYKFFQKVDWGSDVSIIQEADRTDRNIFYIKLI